ncbi:protein binding protein, partial [Dorcoceras hygrometricum]
DQKLKSLELIVEDLREFNLTIINRQQRKYPDFLRRTERVQAELSSYLATTRQTLLDEVQRAFSEANSNLTSFGTQLAKIISHLTRAGDAKKGESSSDSKEQRQWKRTEMEKRCFQL